MAPTHMGLFLDLGHTRHTPGLTAQALGTPRHNQPEPKMACQVRVPNLKDRMTQKRITQRGQGDNLPAR